MRKKMLSVVFSVILTLSMIGALSVSVSLADQSSMPKSPKKGWDADSGTVTTSIGDFGVKVVGRGQTVHFQFWNESDPEVNYNVHFVNLIEFTDQNQDGAFQRNEMSLSPEATTPGGGGPQTTTPGGGGPQTTTPGTPKTAGGLQAPRGLQTILPLAKVDWTFGGFQDDTNEQGEITAVHFSFTSAEINDPAYSDVELQIRCHLYLDNQEAELDGTTYPILGSTELKFDILVANWPWAAPDNLLALQFHIRPDCDDPNRNCTPVAEEFQARNKLNVREAMKQEQQFKGDADPKQQFSFEVANQVAAYFAFANQVKVGNKDSESFKPVECSYTTDGANVQVYLTFPHFEEPLEYDPSVGIGDPRSSSLSEQKPTPEMGWDGTSEQATISIGDFVAQVVGRGEVLHILFWNESDPEVKYTVNFVSLIEFEDLNQDMAFQPNEMKGGSPTILPLAKVDWTFEGFQEDIDDQGEINAVHFSFTGAEISDPTYSDVELQIQCHFYLEPHEVELDGATYPILGSTELKFDILVANWPWAAPDNLLALRFQIRSECEAPDRDCTPVAEEFQARNKLNVREAMNQAQKFKGISEPKQQFSFEVQNQVAAYFAFANQVKVKNAQEESFQPVECSYMTDGANVQVYLTFPHFEESLAYDPSVGIVSSSTTPETTSEAPETTSEAPETTSEAPETTNVTVSEFMYVTFLFGALAILFGIVVPLKKQN